MTEKDLREQWKKENPPAFFGIRTSWEEPIFIEKECCGHGDFRNIERANIDYTKWLEALIIGTLDD